VWLSFLPAGLATSTVTKKLTGIEAFYQHVDDCLRVGCLDDALAAYDVDFLCSADALYEMLDPESERNPFRAGRSRWCVYTIFILLLYQGLRRGELLSLPVDVIKSDLERKAPEPRHWMTVRYNEYEDEGNDPRYDAPSIKNAPSVRQIPVSKPTALLVGEYVASYRGRPDHSFLVNSQKNTPLSHSDIP
jgi:integrase